MSHYVTQKIGQLFRSRSHDSWQVYHWHIIAMLTCPLSHAKPQTNFSSIGSVVWKLQLSHDSLLLTSYPWHMMTMLTCPLGQAIPPTKMSAQLFSGLEFTAKSSLMTPQSWQVIHDSWKPCKIVHWLTSYHQNKSSPSSSLV